MNLLEWAKREIDIACERERKSENAKDGDWEYGCGCYESAFKAFQSLVGDGHSGMSIQITKDILLRLIDGKPLTPIEDTGDIWRFSHQRESNGAMSYQCTRMSSLFKDVNPDGTVTYSDVDRYYCVDMNDPKIPFHNGFVSNIIDEMYPITMPYVPEAKPFKIVREDFLFDPKNGDYDTFAIRYLVKPDGKRVQIDRYFAESEKSFVEITKEEYYTRKLVADARSN